jgi:rod shape-determining protein MreB
MIIDVGGGKTDIAVVSLGGVVSSVSVSTAGNEIDNAIIKYLSEKFRFLIGINTAESIKKNSCNLYCPNKGKKMVLNGENMLSGMPDKLEINECDIYEAVYDCIGFIADSAKEIIENLQPELVSDIIDNGIYLTGGCAAVRGFSECLTSLLMVKCHAEKSAFYCAARGASMAFAKTAYLNDGFTRISMYNNSYSNCFGGL